MLKTGVPGLDVILGGGVPRPGVLVITGNPGTGKTVLASQIAFAQAAAGDSVVIATVTSEPHNKLLHALQSFGFYDGSRVGNEIFLVSAYPYLKKSPKEAREVLIESVRSRKARMLFIDGMRSLRDLWRDEAALRDFLYELGVSLATERCAGIFTSEYPVQTLLDLPEATTVDGIVALSMPVQGVKRPRRIEVVKLRGRPHLRGDHGLHIDERGIHITPRVETWAPPEQHAVSMNERASFGFDGLDTPLHGGVPLGSQTLLAGSTGLGKSLLALHFAVDGARRGAPALFVSFQEPADALVERARGIGLDVRPLLESQQLRVRHIAPVELDADQLAADLRNEIAQGGVRHLVLDSIGDVERTVGDEQRLHHYLAALSQYLRTLGITAVFTKEIPKIVGPELDFSNNPLAVISQNLIFLRALESHGELRRFVSVLKMAASAHDTRMREYTITDQGFTILEPASPGAARTPGDRAPGPKP